MIESIKNKFAELYGDGARCYMSAGRVNLIGEHTDYNLGFVVPGAINYGIYAAVKANELGVLRIFFNDLNLELTVDMKASRPKNQSALYVYGVVDTMREMGIEVPSFDIVIGGDVPNGAGLSSSAALTSCVGYALNDLFSLGLEPKTIARIGQLTEHNYIGVKCGIMDQFASVFGRHGQIIRLDCRSLEYKYEPFEPEKAGLSLVLIDTKVKHNLASSEYNVRREQCEKGVAVVAQKYDNVVSLRDVTIEMLEDCKAQMTQESYNCSRYIVEENSRVMTACSALENDDFETFGKMMNGTHAGLSKLFRVSCEELDVLANFAQSYEGVVGARMMGGGFGGCTINLVKTEVKDAFIAASKAEYKSHFGFEPRVIEVAISDGARRLE